MQLHLSLESKQPMDNPQLFFSIQEGHRAVQVEDNSSRFVIIIIVSLLTHYMSERRCKKVQLILKPEIFVSWSQKIWSRLFNILLKVTRPVFTWPFAATLLFQKYNYLSWNQFDNPYFPLITCSFNKFNALNVKWTSCCHENNITVKLKYKGFLE